MMKSPAGRYPFSRFMASPSRAKRSELEHDSLASTLPGSIGGEAVVANMDGPDFGGGDEKDPDARRRPRRAHRAHRCRPRCRRGNVSWPRDRVQAGQRERQAIEV